MDAQIRKATPEDLKYVESLQKRFSNEVGFLPRQALEWYINAGRLHLAIENGEPAGYTVGREALRWMLLMHPITQAAIQYDAQRRHLGRALVAQHEADARSNAQIAIQVMCREGIEANEFWTAEGFEKIGKVDPNSARGRHIICYRKLLTTWRPKWFYVLPPVAGHQARRTHEAPSQNQAHARTVESPNQIAQARRPLPPLRLFHEPEGGTLPDMRARKDRRQK